MPIVTTPLLPQTVLVPMGTLLVPSKGEFSPANWLYNGELSFGTNVTCWSLTGRLVMPLSVTEVIAVGNSPAPHVTTKAKSCTTLFVWAVTAFTFTSRPITVIE